MSSQSHQNARAKQHQNLMEPVTSPPIMSQVITGMYIAPGIFTIIATGLVSISTLSIGAWFLWQAARINRAMKHASTILDCGSFKKRFGRFTRFSRRFGVTFILSVVLRLSFELLRVSGQC